MSRFFKNGIFGDPLAMSLRMVKCMSNRKNAFTLVELLVVVGIIALLIGLLFTSLGEFRRQAMQTACLSNERQIALASAAYADDNLGRLPSPRTDRLASDSAVSYKNMWVDTAAPGGLVNGYEMLKSLEGGALWTYLGQDQSVYKSPQDPVPVPQNPPGTNPASVKTRIRSYALNGFVGVGEGNYNERCDDLWDFPHPEHPTTPAELRKQWYKTVSISQIPQPSRTMCAITEEDRYNYNTQGWCISIHPSYNQPLFGEWVDSPALWNGSRVNMSYMDGSVESADIIYPSLQRQFQADADSHWVIEGGSRPAFKYMSDRMMPGIIKQSLQ